MSGGEYAAAALRELADLTRKQRRANRDPYPEARPGSTSDRRAVRTEPRVYPLPGWRQRWASRASALAVLAGPPYPKVHYRTRKDAVRAGVADPVLITLPTWGGT